VSHSVHLKAPPPTRGLSLRAARHATGRPQHNMIPPDRSRGALTAVGACLAPLSDSRAPGSNQSGASQLGTQANAGHRWQPSRRPLSPPGPCACNIAWSFAESSQPQQPIRLRCKYTIDPTMYIQYRYTIPNTPLAVQVDASVRSGGDDP